MDGDGRDALSVLLGKPEPLSVLDAPSRLPLRDEVEAISQTINSQFLNVWAKTEHSGQPIRRAELWAFSIPETIQAGMAHSDHESIGMLRQRGHCQCV